MSDVYALLQYIFSIWYQLSVNNAIAVYRISDCGNHSKSEILRKKHIKRENVLYNIRKYFKVI